LIKNGKFFVAPQHFDGNFKELFMHLATSGAGRSADVNGFPSGPWTPDLLAEAITQIDANSAGVELRTVQLWFQDNTKGISSDNIRWLSRIFGCGDPEATSAWQSALSASQARLTAERRHKRNASVTPLPKDNFATTEDAAPMQTTLIPKRRISLAMWSEAIFSRGSPLDLPSFVFAGAVALGFVSYLTGIHSANYERIGGVTKQIGFIWAPNWTILFMIFLPLFFVIVVELLVFWKNEGRVTLLAQHGRSSTGDEWERKVKASSYTYWAVFLVCLLFAGLFQWVGVRLLPLLDGSERYAIDWGSLAVVRPEVISVPQAIVFTGAAYLYMCLCFYLMFVGLILLYTIAFDLWDISSNSEIEADDAQQQEASQIGHRVMRGIFRCTVLGVLIAVCMKLQSFYLTTSSENIIAWFIEDLRSVLFNREDSSDGIIYSRPTHYSSLLVALATCVVFVYGCARTGADTQFQLNLGKMIVAVGLLTLGYLLIGAFAGFSILLSVAVMLAIYGLFDPAYGSRRYFTRKESHNVS
jgi:hypothetical protein